MSNTEFVLSNDPGTIEIKDRADPTKPPEAKEPPVETRTPEQIQADAKELATSMWGEPTPAVRLPTDAPDDINPFSGTPPPGETPPPVVPETPPVVPPEPPVVPETPAVVPPEAPVVPPPAVKPPLTPTPEPELGEQPAVPDYPQTDTEGLSPEDAEDLKALEYLERKGKMVGKADEFRAYVTKHYAYMDEWEKNHPGQTYNPDDPEHEDFYKGQPDINPKELERAKVRMEIEGDMMPEIQKMKQEKAFEAARPIIQQRADVAVLQMLEQVNPDLAAMVKTSDGRPELTEANLAKLEEADPIATQITSVMVGMMKPLVHALDMVSINDLNYHLNPRNNPVHAEIDTYRAKLEADMQSAPPEQQIVEGRQFKTISQYLKGEQDIRKGPGTAAEKAQKLATYSNSHWTLHPKQIKDMIIRDTALKTKELIDQTEQMATKKYGNQRVSAKKTEQPPTPEPKPEPVPDNGKPKPPSIASGSDLVTTPKTLGGGAKTFGESITDNLFS